MQSMRPPLAVAKPQKQLHAEKPPRRPERIELHPDETYEVLSAAFKSVAPALVLADRFDSLSPEESESLLKAFRKFERRYNRAKDVTPPKASAGTESNAGRPSFQGDEFQLGQRSSVTVNLSPEDFQVVAHEYKPIPPGSDDLVVKLGLPFLPDKKKG
jgi:hypothetical protein